MSLNWNVENVKGYKELCWVSAPADAPHGEYKKGEDILNPVTHALIFHTIAIGIGEITEENAREFYVRVHCWEAMKGASLQHREKIDGKDTILQDYITEEQVREHIGLTTNVFPKEKLPVFWKKLMETR